MTIKTWVPEPIGLQPSATSSSIATWIEDLRQALLDVGLVQTTDTGQFDSGTFVWTPPGTLNGTSAEFTYLVFRFDDTLQSTAPIVLRIGIRASHGNTANGYQVGSSIEVGSATDGAGNITADSSGSMVFSCGYGDNGAPTNPDAYQSFATFSSAKGFAAAVFNPGNRALFGTDYYGNWSQLSFIIERIPDVSGSPTGSGYTLWARHQTYNYTAFNNTTSYNNVDVMGATTVLFGSGPVASDNPNSVPYVGSVGLVAPDMFCGHAFHLTPEPVRANGLVLYPQGRIVHGAEFDLRVYGTTDSRFLAMDHRAALRPSPAVTAADPAFLWE